MRRRAGTVCMIIGAVLLLAALSLFTYNRWDAWRAGRTAPARYTSSVWTNDLVI